VQQTATRSSGLDEVVDNIDSEQPRGRHDNAGSHDNAGGYDSSQYVIVHSGVASKVNGAMHPSLHALPDHVQPAAYIFTSDRYHDIVSTMCVCLSAMPRWV